MQKTTELTYLSWVLPQIWAAHLLTSVSPPLSFLDFFFDVDHLKIIFIEFITILLLFYNMFGIFFWPRGTWDVSSLTRDGTHTTHWKMKS